MRLEIDYRKKKNDIKHKDMEAKDVAKQPMDHWRNKGINLKKNT